MAGLMATYGRARHSLANILDLFLLVFNANVAGNVSYKRYLCVRWWYFMTIARPAVGNVTLFSPFLMVVGLGSAFEG